MDFFIEKTHNINLTIDLPIDISFAWDISVRKRDKITIERNRDP